MDKFISWVVTSSSDPRAISLTVKGVLGAVLPFIILITGLSEADINPFINVIVDIVYTLTTLVSLVVMGVGLVRKAKLGRWSAPPEE